MKALRLLAGLVALGLVLRFVDPRQVLETLFDLDPSILCVLLGVVAVLRLMQAWKWNLLLRARDIHISLWQALRLSLISHFTGSWTPGQVGGDAYRVIALRHFGKSPIVLSTLLVERYMGLCAVSFFALISLPVTMPVIYEASPWLLLIVLSAIVVVAVIVPCLFSHRFSSFLFTRAPWIANSSVGRKIQQFYKTVMEFRHHQGTLVAFGLVTMVQTMLYFVVNYLAARALGLDVHLLFFLFAMPIVHLLLRIPISSQGFGIQEGCFAFAMVLHGFTPAEGLAVSVVQRALEWTMSIVPGGVLLWLTEGLSSQDEPADTSSSGGFRSPVATHLKS